MTQPLVAIAATKNSEPLETAINMLNANTDVGKSLVHAFIFFGQGIVFAFLSRNPACLVQMLNTLEPAIG